MRHESISDAAETALVGGGGGGGAAVN